MSQVCPALKINKPLTDSNESFCLLSHPGLNIKPDLFRLTRYLSRHIAQYHLTTSRAPLGSILVLSRQSLPGIRIKAGNRQLSNTKARSGFGQDFGGTLLSFLGVAASFAHARSQSVAVVWILNVLRCHSGYLSSALPV